MAEPIQVVEIAVAGAPDELLERLFAVDDGGELVFRGLAVATGEATVRELEQRVVEFRETVLEAFVRHGLEVRRRWRPGRSHDASCRKLRTWYGRSRQGPNTVTNESPDLDEPAIRQAPDG